VISVLEAARAVSAGLASVVVCAAADSFTVAKHDEMVGAFTESIRDYIAPLGFGGANGLFALVQRRHMHEYGTRREQLGHLAVAQRRHALANPNALFQVPLTLEDYLEARIIADPIRLFDCVMPCAGGDAVVVTTEERARRCPGRPLRILSGGQAHNWRHEDVVPVTQGWVTFADGMFDEAGVARDEVDFVQLYDDYPIMEVIQLEDLGFCEKGDGGRFVAETDLSLTGTLPVNTGGGQLSAGQAGAAGGMIGVTEAVAQLQGAAGDRQVEHAAMGLVSGFGMVGYGRGLSCSAMLLSNDRHGDGRRG
jgi:acetyl-CoA acetyltransferase